jgi:MinD-like ATPase involved in chromosome partitioning or flagellar assembly
LAINFPSEDDPTWASMPAEPVGQEPGAQQQLGDEHEPDDVEGRAARLMAQIAAQRMQREMGQPEPIDDVPPPQTNPEPEPVDYTTAQPVAPLYGEPLHQPSEPEPHQVPTVSDDEQNQDESSPRPFSGRPMALPPWQAAPSALGTEFDAKLDAAQRSAEDRKPVAEREEPSAEPAPSHALPPRGWPAGPPPPPPPPGWQGPPPGWPPGLPPPPPGWQGPPPWMPPPHHGPPQWSAKRDSAPQSEQPTDHAVPQLFQMQSSYTDAETVGGDRQTPQSGWRRAMHELTGGRLNPGISRKERELRELLEQIRQPIATDFRIAVLSIKGGVGKTTTTLGLGSALAMVRTDRVIAVDANPDRGTLAERVPDASSASTVRDLLRDPNINRYADVRNHTRMAASRLEVLASEQDPAVAEVFGETDYRRTMEILRRYYNIILTDCGTGIIHSAMAGVLDLAHTIVLVTSPTIDAARSASATLDWLSQHGRENLVRDAHVVISAAQSGPASPQSDKIFDHFDERCASTHAIPFETHLAEGADFDFASLKPATTQAYLELAGAVSDKFSGLRAPYEAR